MSKLNDDDNTSNALIAPKKRDPIGVSYNSRSYYTTNFTNSGFNEDNYENTYIGLPCT